MRKCDVIVIGRGLFGSMIYNLLNESGLDVVIIDSNEPMSASKCSFGVWKEGWINDVIKKEANSGMGILDRFAEGIKDIQLYNIKKDRLEDFKKVDCSKILVKDEYEWGRIVSIKNKVVRYHVNTDGEIVEIAARRAIIVAAGAWTTDVLKLAGIKENLPKIDRVWGATLDLKLQLEENRILEWAPYRQSVLVRMNGHFCFGDGATVKNPKISDVRVENASNRLLNHLNDIVGVNVSPDRIIDVNEGYRPYLKKGTTSLVNNHNDWLISATGGAKNSTILCGYVARTVLDMLP